MGKNVLFICSANVDRSPPAEELYRQRRDFDISVKSAGVSSFARKPITDELIEWADLIFVMEDRHKSAVLKKKPSAKDRIFVLNIEDIYFHGDPILKG
ncbi:MAG: protein tyrosine phosphatase [Promethearchaeota archaeon]|nr:MAG: protein tyrosine phosphatase [Candidatus Lokiarchaeota archaeon]